MSSCSAWNIAWYLLLVAAVGFVFHACLLLVLLLWKPSGDDPALFYVIPAAWGVCNAIWEILNFSEFQCHVCMYVNVTAVRALTTNLLLICSFAGHRVPRLLAGTIGTLLLLPLPRAVTGLWASWRSLQLAETICPGSGPRLGCGTLHVARNETRVPPQTQNAHYHLVTQAVSL